MPVFHTKTIEKILEPVAEQVSQLVILHEKGEEGAAMPPLEQPIGAVKAAVTNLATIGRGQIQTTKDEVLKLDTPPAIKHLEHAADLLVDAAKVLDADNLSKEGREKLITGARGILQGTSDLLLVFDAAEVRRICRVCQSVRDYLKVCEVVQQIEDLLAFVKNLTPGMTSMTKQVTQRSNDLTNSIHSQKLLEKVDTLKVRLPNLFSSMKAYVTIVAEDNQSGLPAASENRKFYVDALSEEITNIIHLLQLVSTDKEMELKKMDMTKLAILNDAVTKNAQLAKQWLLDPGCSWDDDKGQLALYKTISDAKALGEEIQGYMGEKIFKSCDNIMEKVEQLQALSKEDKFHTPNAIQLNEELQLSMNDLESIVNASLKELHTIEQARNAVVLSTPIVKEWLLDPSAKPNHVIHDSMQQLKNANEVIMNQLDKNHRSSSKSEELKQLCEDIDEAMKKMTDFRENGNGHLPEARELGKHTAAKIVQLNNAISAAYNQPISFQTLETKITDIKKWLEDPDVNDGGQGMLAASSIIASVYGLAGNVKNAEIRSQMLQKATECEKLSKELYDLQRSGLGDSPQALEIAKKLEKEFTLVEEMMKDALVKAVADEFSDTSVIMKQFKFSAQAAKDVPNRESDFEEASFALQKHAVHLAKLSQQAVGVSELGTEEKIEKVKNVGHKLTLLSPQLIKAGRVVLEVPENKQAQEHLKALSDEWTAIADELTDQVDDAMEVSKFIAASEEGIKLEVEKSINAMHEEKPTVVVLAAGNIARRANRILMAGKREVENTDEVSYVNEISEDLKVMDSSVSPVIQATRVYAQTPSSKEAQAEVQSKEEDLLKAILKVRQTVEVKAMDEKVRLIQVTKQDESNEVTESILTRDGPGIEEDQEIPACPPLPKEEELPPRPPLPEEDEFPEEDDDDDHEMMHAARKLHEETTKWEAKGNDLIGAAKQMALLMAKMSRLVRDEGGKKSELIACAKEIAKSSSAVTSMSLAIAEKCTDKRIRNDMKRTLDKIPTISTQLRILSTVKAASLGGKEDMTQEEEDAAVQATEMLVLNAQNLMLSVKDTVRYAEAASIRIRADTDGTVRWVRK